jgi:hypothetical protein
MRGGDEKFPPRSAAVFPNVAATGAAVKGRAGGGRLRPA